MTDGDKKRKAIFDKFANNLTLLIEHNILKDINLKFEKTYICPICMEQFSEEALNQNFKNPLTLEDAPPKSLGGKANILTCKSCNNTCGHKIDFHLTERMRELDHLHLLPNTEFNAKFEQNGKTVQGTIKIDRDGTMQAIHKNKTNNPINLSTYIKSISKKRRINLNFLESKFDPFKLQLALLKTGFLMTFSQYGYAFILNPTYDIIRKQLLNPEDKIYPTEFWFQAPFPNEVFGVPFISEPNLEALLPIFPLSTDSSVRPFATIIPLTIKPIEETILELKRRFKETKEFAVEMLPMALQGNYLTDLDAITYMTNWISDRTKIIQK